MYDWAEFRHFRYLLTILEKRGVRIAAEELHTSQPNLSIQARQFQENASIRLFRKPKNGRIYPTQTGLAFLNLAPLVLETRDEVIDALIAIERNEISTVRLGCTPLADPALFRTFCKLHKELMPKCMVRPTHGDAPQLIQEIADGMVDAALVTLPLQHPDLRVEELCRDRLVVCLRQDHTLAPKAALSTMDLQDSLQIFYDPQRDPIAHHRLLELLSEAGITVEEYCRASHPTEMQTLVKEGYGLALIREGTPLDKELTTRPITNMKWTVDTAIVFHRERHPKTIPVLTRKLRKQMENNLHPTLSSSDREKSGKRGVSSDSEKDNRPA